MQVQGTIYSVTPTGGYESQNGYIWTFEMVVNGPNGQIHGEIGAKSEQYPIVPGQPILVDSYLDKANKPRLKKINPKFVNQLPSQALQPPTMPTVNVPPQPTYTPVKQADGRNQSIERQSAIKSACALLAGTNADLEEIVAAAYRFTHFYETGKPQITGNQDGFLDQGPEFDQV